MALTPDELIAISDLEKAQIADSSVVPDWVLPAEVRGSSAPINGIPYPQHTIDVFGGLLAGEWSLKFQNPLQRVVCDLEIFHGENAPESTPPDLSALQLTATGFDKAVIFCPAKTYYGSSAGKLHGAGCFRRYTSVQAGRKTQISGAVWDGCHPVNRDSTVNAAANQSGSNQGAIRYAETQE